MNANPEITISDNRNVQNKTRTDILNEADEIYKKWKKMCKDRGIKRSELRESKNNEKLDEIFDLLRQEHKDFAFTYPIQLRYLAQLGEYHHDAMNIFLLKLETKPWKSEEDYINYQAEYVKLVFMKTRKHWTTKDAEAVYLDAKNILHKEHTDLKRTMEKVENEMKKEELCLNVQKRQDMLEIVKQRLEEIRAKKNTSVDTVTTSTVTTAATDTTATVTAVTDTTSTI